MSKAQSASASAQNARNFRVPMAGTVLSFVYKNWKGNVRRRIAKTISLEFIAEAPSVKPRWVLRALDLEKNLERSFCLENMTDMAEVRHE